MTLGEIVSVEAFCFMLDFLFGSTSMATLEFAIVEFTSVEMTSKVLVGKFLLNALF